MLPVLSDNAPKYIEDFRITTPDWANDNSPTGDPLPDDDWLPAFKRAASEHLPIKSSDPLRFQLTYRRPILLGRSRSQYKLSDTLHLVGIRLEGVYPGVELLFTSDCDGIHIHYPKTRPGSGTSSALDAPLTDYGGMCSLRNLVLRGRGAAGTRGIIIQHVSYIESVEVYHWGWHGFHVSADVLRKADTIDGAISNANGTTILHCRADSCGHAPGHDERLISAANPEGHRPFGSGLRIQGGDTNICFTRSFNGSSCAAWAIDDVGFLGNVHLLPHCVNCYHDVTEWEVAIGTHTQATATEKRDFRVYGIAAGSRVQYAYRVENANARSLLIAPYVENATVPPIMDVSPPSFVIAGIGGKDSSATRRISAGKMSNAWSFVQEGPYGKSDETGFAEGDGVLLSFKANADDTRPYRLKYVHYNEDDPELSEQSPAWAGFFRLDRANADTQIAIALTGLQSYEKTSRKARVRKLLPGKLALLSHYRAVNSMLIRQVEYGSITELTGLEAKMPAADRMIGDSYICLSPKAGGIYEAVVIDNPAQAGAKIWAAVSTIRVP